MEIGFNIIPKSNPDIFKEKISIIVLPSWGCVLGRASPGCRDDLGCEGCTPHPPRIAAMDMDKEELKSLWWLIKWALFWILVLLLFGGPFLIF